MEAKENIKQLVKAIKPDETAAAAANINYSEKTAPSFIDVPEKPEINLKVEKLYNLNHTQSNYYYKAHSLNLEFNNIYCCTGKEYPQDAAGHFYVKVEDEYLTKQNIIIGVSYETNILILDLKTGVLLINKEYYNCSVTTKEHYNTFTWKHRENITSKIFLNSECFNIMEDYLFNKKILVFNEKIQYLLSAANYEKPVFNILMNPEQTRKENINNFLDMIHFNKDMIKKYLRHELQFIPRAASAPNFIINDEIQELKTREKHVLTIYKNRVKIELIFSCRKKSKTIISDIKFNILEADYLTNDIRTNQDKILYNGYDIGITNTKELKPVEFKRQPGLYYGFY